MRVTSLKSLHKPLKRSPLKRGKCQLKRTPLKRGNCQLKRTPLNRIGKIGESNLKANSILHKRWANERIDYCEIGNYFTHTGFDFFGCLENWTLQNVHRHKRIFYNGDVDKLSDRKQVLRGCTACHDRIEHDAELTEKVFLELRGPEEEKQ